MSLSIATANRQTERNFYYLLFDNAILSEIVSETNHHIEEKIQVALPITRKSQWYEWDEVGVEEIRVSLNFDYFS